MHVAGLDLWGNTSADEPAREAAAGAAGEGFGLPPSRFW